MCGLAASLMAAEIMKTENHLDLELEDFLECAQNSGFTKQVAYSVTVTLIQFLSLL